MDQHRKAQLRIEFKNAQRWFRKQHQQELEFIAKPDPLDMWSRLKKINNPSSTRAALEIVRADNTISSDLKEILE